MTKNEALVLNRGLIAIVSYLYKILFCCELCADGLCLCFVAWLLEEGKHILLICFYTWLVEGIDADELA